jgi:hypothetical protein
MLCADQSKVAQRYRSTSSAQPADHQGIVHLIVQPQLSNARTAEDESAQSKRREQIY